MTVALKDQQFSISFLNGKYPTTEPIPALYNEVFQYWKNFWTDWSQQTDGSNGASYLNVENFLKHDLMIVVTSMRGVICGMMSCSLHNLSSEASYELPYLRDYPAEFLQNLKARGRGLAITGEYLSVKREFRKVTFGVSLAEILIGLQLKLMHHLDADYALGTGLKSVRMPDACHKFGYKTVGILKKCNLECDALVNDRSSLRRHPDHQIAHYIDALWNDRRDLTLYQITSEEIDIKNTA